MQSLCERNIQIQTFGNLNHCWKGLLRIDIWYRFLDWQRCARVCVCVCVLRYTYRPSEKLAGDTRANRHLPASPSDTTHGKRSPRTAIGTGALFDSSGRIGDERRTMLCVHARNRGWEQCRNVLQSFGECHNTTWPICVPAMIRLGPLAWPASRWERSIAVTTSRADTRFDLNRPIREIRSERIADDVERWRYEKKRERCDAWRHAGHCCVGRCRYVPFVNLPKFSLK